MVAHARTSRKKNKPGKKRRPTAKHKRFTGNPRARNRRIAAAVVRDQDALKLADHLKGVGPEAGPGHTGNRTQKFVSHLREWTRSSAYILGGIYDYNPDDLVINKGLGVRIYQDMRREPYIKAALNIKKLSVARQRSRILPASASPRDREIAEFVQWTLDNMDTTTDTLLWGLLDFVDIGYSINEMNFQIIERGRWAGKIGFKSIKSKDPYVYSFRITPHGDVAAVVQRFGGVHNPQAIRDAAARGGEILGVRVNDHGQNEFDPRKFMICSFMPLYTNPYGSSDLRAAYRAFFIKDWAWKFRAIFMEKWGMPPIVGKFPNGTSEARRKQLEEVLDSIQNDTVLTIPEDLEIEVIKMFQEGRTTEFEKAIADLNKEALVGIMGSFLAVEEGKRTGARAQGQVHLSVVKLFIEHLTRVVSDCLNKSLVKTIVDLNFDTDVYPKHAFEVSRAQELMIEAELDKVLLDMGMQLDSQYMYNKYERPVPEGVEIPKVLTGGAMKTGGVDQPVPASFDPMRRDALPDDSRKIGALREVYQWFLRMEEAHGGKVWAKPVMDIAFELAGNERKYYDEHGKWMPAEIALEQFLIATKNASQPSPTSQT